MKKGVSRRWKQYTEELMNEQNVTGEGRWRTISKLESAKDRSGGSEGSYREDKEWKAQMTYLWRHGDLLGEKAVEFLTRLFSTILESERMPEEVRRVLVPIFKRKSEV